MELIFGLPAGLLTYWLAQQKFMNTILASSLVGLVGCLIPDYAHIIYGASFIGMSSPKHFNFKQVAAASFIFPLIFMLISQIKPDLGGALGFSAFLSILLAYSTVFFYQKINSNQ